MVALVVVLAGLAVVVEFARRFRAGRDPLGPSPDGELPDTTVALLLGVVAYVALLSVVFGALAGTELRRVGGTSVDVAAEMLVKLALVLALLRPALSGTCKPTLSAGRVALVGVLAGLATFGVVAVIGKAIEFLLTFSGGAVPVQDVVSTAKGAAGAELVFVGVLAVVLAPFAEEVFFRGVLYPALVKATGERAGLLLQAIAFGAIHVVAAPATWLLAIPLAVVGWFAGWIYRRTGSLAAPILLHATFNAINFALLRAMPAAGAS